MQGPFRFYHTFTVGLVFLNFHPVLPAQESAIPAPALFEPVVAAGRGAAEKPYVLRSQPVRVDLELLSALSAQGKINLNLFPDAALVGAVERIQKRAGNRFTMAGGIEGVPHSRFIIVVEENVAVGTIRMPTLSQLFKLGYLGDGVHVVSQIDDSQFPPCGGTIAAQEPAPDSDISTEGEQSPFPPPDDSDSPLRGACNALDPIFDVMIVYTDAASQAVGGTTAIRAIGQLAVESINEAYVNSEIDARVRLVHQANVEYDENGTFANHLSRLIGTSDGYMDNIHSLRSTYRADIVTLLVDDDDGFTTCGIASCVPAQDRAMNVVNWDCAVDNLSYAHEVGHLQGCDHDRDNSATGCHAYAYSYGWRFNGSSGLLYRTIMSYDPGFRVGHFSNPSVTFEGTPTGVSIGQTNQSHNAQTIINRAAIVEGFRVTRYDVWVDFLYGGSEQGTFSQPYDTVLEGVNAVVSGSDASERPNLWIKAGSTSAPVTLDKLMTIRACGGSVTIGQ